MNRELREQLKRANERFINNADRLTEYDKILRSFTGTDAEDENGRLMYESMVNAVNELRDENGLLTQREPDLSKLTDIVNKIIQSGNNE